MEAGILTPLFDVLLAALGLSPAALLGAVVPLLGAVQALKRYFAPRWPGFMGWVRPGVFFAWGGAGVAAWVVVIEGAGPEALANPVTWLGFGVAVLFLVAAPNQLYNIAGKGKKAAPPPDSKPLKARLDDIPG